MKDAFLGALSHIKQRGKEGLGDPPTSAIEVGFSREELTFKDDDVASVRETSTNCLHELQGQPLVGPHLLSHSPTLNYKSFQRRSA